MHFDIKMHHLGILPVRNARRDFPVLLLFYRQFSVGRMHHWSRGAWGALGQLSVCPGMKRKEITSLESNLNRFSKVKQTM